MGEPHPKLLNPVSPTQENLILDSAIQPKILGYGNKNRIKKKAEREITVYLPNCNIIGIEKNVSSLAAWTLLTLLIPQH